jgi:hypothetical protein
LRQVRLADGRQYTHSCSLPSFEEIARYIEENPRARLSVETLRRAWPHLPFSQTHVALPFLLERGVIALDRPNGRFFYAASTTVFEDAMEIFFHLAEVGT